MLARILDADNKLHATTNVAEIRAALAAKKRLWIELERQSPEGDALLGELQIHPLTIEDIWGPQTAPKIDDFPNYLYVVVHGIGSARRSQLELVEVDIVIGSHWVITHDRDGLVADDLGTELDHSSRTLVKGPAWLAHAVLDRVVDRYLPIITQLDHELDQLEIDVLDKAGTPRGKRVMARILAFKRMLQTLRRMSIHQREILMKLSRGEFDEIPAELIPFYRDVYDHFVRVQDILEGYRDLVTSALDAFLSVQSNRMNEVMKTLTLMSTVMLPLSFVAGLYGMNFDPAVSPWNMPELKWVHGYPFALGLMALIALGILYFFRHKGYIGTLRDEETKIEKRLERKERKDRERAKRPRA